MFDRNRHAREADTVAPAARRTAFAVATLALGMAAAHAQEAEPRAYSNTPVGVNFLIAGHVYAQGKMAFDPDLAIADATFHSNTALLAYVRSFALGGQSAKFDVIVPSSAFSAEALVNGQPLERAMSGPGDPRFRLSVNLFGAPALSAKEFSRYRQDTVIGVSVQVSAPLGNYDDTKLLNLGNTGGRSGRSSGCPGRSVSGRSRWRRASPSSRQHRFYRRQHLCTGAGLHAADPSALHVPER